MQLSSIKLQPAQAMLIQSRQKHANRRLTYNTTLATKDSPQKINPEIQALVDRLQCITSSIPEDNINHLNLINWEKEKYKPNESENRIRIENRISLIKVCNERVRSRIKPIKRNSLSLDGSKCEVIPDSYKEHYKQLMSAKRKRSYSDSFESEEDLELNEERSTSESTNIKYYENLKKYKKVVRYIQEKIEERNESKQKNRRTFYSEKKNRTQGSWNDTSHLSKTLRFVKTAKEQIYQYDDQQSNIKVSNIVQKWKPIPKAEQKFDVNIKPKLAKSARKTNFVDPKAPPVSTLPLNHQGHTKTQESKQLTSQYQFEN